MTTLFRNGRFFVASGDVGVACDLLVQCMVIKDDLMEHVVGERDAAVLRAEQTGTSIIDLQNRIRIPGFIDGHMYFLLLGLAFPKVNLGRCKIWTTSELQ